ncbi:copper oxidase, partial [Corynebacterium hesseae]
VIATDTGLLDAPVEVESLLFGPGERAEIIVDLEPGEEVQLRSVPRKDNFGVPKDKDAADSTLSGP